MKDELKKKLEARIKRANKNLFTRTNIKKIAEDTGDRIKKRVRLGYGNDRKGGSQDKLAGLSDSYIEQREFDRKGRLNKSYTTPLKSNLTYTGQMLDSISGKSITKEIGEIYFKGNRDDGLSNKEVAQYTSKLRPFFDLTKAEINNLKRRVRDLALKLYDKEL